MTVDASPEISTRAEEYIQVVNKLNSSMGLDGLKWQDTNISVTQYLKEKVQVVDFDRLFRGISQEQFLQFTGTIIEEDGKMAFNTGNDSDANFFAPQATNGTTQFKTVILRRIQNAKSSGIFSDEDIDQSALSEIENSDREVIISFSDRILKSTGRSAKQVIAAESGHIIAKSFDIPLPVEIEEAFDRVAQVAVGFPIPQLTDDQMEEMDRQKLADAEIIDEYIRTFEGTNSMGEAELKKLERISPQALQSPILRAALERKMADPVPSLEFYLNKIKGEIGYRQHVRGEYIVDGVYKALGGDYNAREQLPRVFVNALIQKKAGNSNISTLNFDSLTTSITSNLPLLTAKAA